MRKLVLVGTVLVAVGLGTASSFALASTASTLFVDPESGVDTGLCPQTAPCLTLNYALSQAAANASIFIEKGGTFGPIYLNEGVSIAGPADGSVVIQFASSTAPGCMAGQSCPSTATYAVDIDAGSSNIVKFKNVIISNGGGTNGAVHIGNNFGVAFKQVAFRGGSGTIPEMILVNPNALNGSGGPVQLYFANCDIGFSSSGGGLYIAPTVSVNVLFQGGEVHNSNFGIKADATAGPLPSGSSIQVATDATEFFSHSTGAVIAKTGSTPGATGGVHFVLTRSTILGTGSYAAYANGANASMILYEDTISGNFVGVDVANSGTMISMQNNEIFGNTTNCEVGGALSACDGGTLTVQALQ
jgi:hypothetical protein